MAIKEIELTMRVRMVDDPRVDVVPPQASPEKDTKSWTPAVVSLLGVALRQIWKQFVVQD